MCAPGDIELISTFLHPSPAKAQHFKLQSCDFYIWPAPRPSGAAFETPAKSVSLLRATHSSARPGGACCLHQAEAPPARGRPGLHHPRGERPRPPRSGRTPSAGSPPCAVAEIRPQVGGIVQKRLRRAPVVREDSPCSRSILRPSRPVQSAVPPLKRAMTALERARLQARAPAPLVEADAVEPAV